MKGEDKSSFSIEKPIFYIVLIIIQVTGRTSVIVITENKEVSSENNLVSVDKSSDKSLM